MSKYDYVRDEARKPAGNHHCHWPGCGKPVPPALWGCKAHWMLLPLRIRRRIWAAYKPGQEIKKTPTREYVLAAREAEDWIVRFLRTAGKTKKGLIR